jgi:hypothetical protein
MIDNSPAIAPMQQLFTSNLPAFMDVLEGLPGGLPSMHVAVVSSSMGAGIWGDVPGCFPVSEQNDDGEFRYLGVYPPGCAAPAGKFIIADAAGNKNFPGDISAALGCIANIGDLGCGFEQPFRAVEAALQRSLADGDTNSGFLRPDAVLAVVMLTNEDDCSVPWDSLLFDPRQSHVTDPLGGLQTGYRCNEFGHLCDGVPPPHTVSGDTVLQNCTSAEDLGRLIPVSTFAESLRSFKADPESQIFVAAIAGPPTPYIVELRQNVMTTDGGVEAQPAIARSCGPQTVMPGLPVHAYPGVRVRQLIESFGDQGVFESICSSSYQSVMQRIARELGRMLVSICLPPDVPRGAGGTADCRVTLRRLLATGPLSEQVIPSCAPGRTNPPCWQIAETASCAQELFVCWDTACSTGHVPPDIVDGRITCDRPSP